MIAKQESVDYYYSNCNNSVPPPAAITASMNFMDHGTGDGNTFPSFYSLINANNVGRRADEMLSGHGYRLFFYPLICLILKDIDRWINLFPLSPFAPQVTDGLSV